MKWISALVFAFATAPAFAGFIEVGGSVNYRSSGYDKYNYIESLTYTASVSYYFWEQCAWELNYTAGTAVQSTKGKEATPMKTVISDNIEMTSLDLVLSLAQRQDPFRPYIKFGAGYLSKDRYRKINNDAREKISSQNGIVPSGGIGFSVNVTKEFSIKIGVDAWTSPLDETPLVVDYAGRAGVSYIF
jgi:outer membrane protein W